MNRAKLAAMTQTDEPAIIQRYDGRRLYHTGPAGCVGRGGDSGADITRSVLKSIMTQRTRHD